MSPPALLGAVARLGLFVLGASPAAPSSPNAPSATVVFAGDVIPHGNVLDALEQHGPASLYQPIAPVIRAADLALVNLETPAVPTAPEPRSGMRFNVHPGFVKALADAGFDGASMANNHSYDQGLAGVGATVRTLRATGLRPAGGALAGEDPLVPARFSIAGGTLCVIAATRLHNYYLRLRGAATPRVAAAQPTWSGEESALIAAIRRAHTDCGAVLVSLHTGLEYLDAPLPRDRAFFRRVALAGADAVIGHHSHTPQPVELFTTPDGRQVPFFYSLGNFVSAQGFAADADLPQERWGRLRVAYDARLREGLLAVLRFAATGNGRLRVAEFGYVPLWTVNTSVSHQPGDHGTIAGSLMPRAGGGDAMLRRRWDSLVRRTGADYLLPESRLPGAREGYRLSTAAVAEARRALARRPPPTPAQITLASAAGR